MASDKDDGARAKGPGRPAQSEDSAEVKARLLEAAERLFAEKGYSAVSIRQVATEADVTPAMVHYYFQSKNGLYKALLDSIAARLLGRIGEAMEQGIASQHRLTALIDVFASAAIKDPWLPSLILREVILDEGNFRDYFIETYASKVAALIPAGIAGEVEGGQFRTDLDPQLAFVSMLGMTAFPFLARPVMERLFGFSYDASFEQEFIKHTSKIFLYGVTSGGEQNA